MSIENIKDTFYRQTENIYLWTICGGYVFTAILMYVRAFYGTEITDEAYYVSNTIEVLKGNIPFAYNTSMDAGSSFFLLPITALYRFLIPDMEGFFLFSRICFVTCKVLVSIIIYVILNKNINKANALLLAGVLLPVYGALPNFSYNTVPLLLLLVAGCLLYDVIEQKGLHDWLKLAVSGVTTAIACFANPGWGLAIVIFLCLIVFRAEDRNGRIKRLQWFLGAVVFTGGVIVSFLAMRTSIADVLQGFYSSVVPQIAMDSMGTDHTWENILNIFVGPLKSWGLFFLPSAVFVYFFSVRYIREGEKKLESVQCLVLAISTGMLVYMTYCAYVTRGQSFIYATGLITFSLLCGLIIFGAMGLYKEEKIVWYLALYPVSYSLAALLFLEVGGSIGRFVNSITIAIPILYVLLKNKSELVRLTAMATAFFMIVFLGYMDFHYVYRDSNFRKLTTPVATGVYRGIYTTAERAHDLPQMELYLNGIIGENETYAFRDNVPAGYLMVHKGWMCDIRTWDCLQYSYHANSPAILFDYYKRRNMIPEKIIYVDYGRDKQLSIDDPNFRYNDFVNAYYDLVEDIELNEIFKRIKVYQYNGKFDGNYQYWIDTYWQPTKPKKNSLF